VSADPETHIDPFVLQALGRGCNILQKDRRAVSLPDDQVVVFVRRSELTLRLEQEAAMCAIELSCAGIVGAVLDGSGQIIQCRISHSHG